jgi:hypothetical protein
MQVRAGNSASWAAWAPYARQRRRRQTQRRRCHTSAWGSRGCRLHSSRSSSATPPLLPQRPLIGPGLLELLAPPAGKVDPVPPHLSYGVIACSSSQSHSPSSHRHSPPKSSRSAAPPLHDDAGARPAPAGPAGLRAAESRAGRADEQHRSTRDTVRWQRGGGRLLLCGSTHLPQSRMCLRAQHLPQRLHLRDHQLLHL